MAHDINVKKLNFEKLKRHNFFSEVNVVCVSESLYIFLWVMATFVLLCKNFSPAH